MRLSVGAGVPDINSDQLTAAIVPSQGPAEKSQAVQAGEPFDLLVEGAMDVKAQQAGLDAISGAGGFKAADRVRLQDASVPGPPGPRAPGTGRITCQKNGANGRDGRVQMQQIPVPVAFGQALPHPRAASCTELGVCFLRVTRSFAWSARA